MAIFGKFGKLFGGNRTPQKSFAELEKEREAERVRQYAAEKVRAVEKFTTTMKLNESPIPDAGQSESLESPRTVKCFQFKYGKRVQTPDGPVVRGMEHTITAAPADPLVRKVAKIIPEEIPFGVGTWTNLQKLQYKPIVKVSRIVDGSPYVICGLTSSRGEGGVGKPGRGYTEAHFIAVPASDWSVAVIPQLIKLLNNTPRGDREPLAMPELEVNTDVLDKPLAQNWLSDARDILVRLASGQTLSIQAQTALEQDVFLNNIFHALICLPEKVARRISFGSGIGPELQEADFGLRAFLGMTGFEHGPMKVMDNPWTHDDATKLKLGEEYVAVLMPLIASAKTPREVMRAVQKLPANITEQVVKRIFP